MAAPDPKTTLHSYLDVARDAMLWKLEGLSEYDIRRPMTPTGTNLLGLVKHLAGVELGYFGETFGRPSDEPFPWFDEGAELNADMWATPDETRVDVLGLYARVRAHADGTIEDLDLDAIGRVPHWPAERSEVTLHQILVHVATETNRHLGHADILRETIDGAAGHRVGVDNMPPAEADWWAAYCERLEAAARAVDPQP